MFARKIIHDIYAINIACTLNNIYCLFCNSQLIQLINSISFVLIGFVKIPIKCEPFLMEMIMKGFYNANSHCDVYIGGS